jgi:hypothetical protein
MIALSLIAHGLYHFVFYVFWHDIIRPFNGEVQQAG